MRLSNAFSKVSVSYLKGEGFKPCDNIEQFLIDTALSLTMEGEGDGRRRGLSTLSETVFVAEMKSPSNGEYLAAEWSGK